MPLQCLLFFLPCEGTKTGQKMKVIVDDKIPYIRQTIESIANEVVYLPGKSIDNAAARDADALVIRTRTKANAALLEGTKVKFIATATIGFDHIDTAYCRSHGIEWNNCPGCNAASVEQYMQSALILIEQYTRRSLDTMTIGIVGVGHVGSRVARMARQMNMKVLLNDPPRQEKEGPEGFCSMDEIVSKADIITFHTPLVKDGPYHTLHMADSTFFASLKKKPVIINTCRGEVTDTQALKQAMTSGQILTAVIDVWENEPDIDRQLLSSVLIATPHIAGYSADGKANASRMSAQNLCRFFGIDRHIDIEPPLPQCTRITAPDMKQALLQIYNPMDDCRRLREAPERFEWLRGNYPLRREREAYTIEIGK